MTFKVMVFAFFICNWRKSQFTVADLSMAWIQEVASLFITPYGRKSNMS